MQKFNNLQFHDAVCVASVTFRVWAGQENQGQVGFTGVNDEFGPDQERVLPSQID